MSFEPDLFLEIRRGAAIVPVLIGLIVLAIYLFRETKRRDLSVTAWSRLPPGMNLVLAFFLFDLGILIETVVIWYWRLMGAGDLTGAEVSLLVGGGILVVTASLCKVRALTYPDRGNKPWLWSLALTSLAILVLIWIS